MGQMLLYRVGQFLVRYLPLSWSYSVAKALAFGQYQLSKEDRTAVAKNLKTVLAREPRPDEIKAVFENFAIYLVEFLKLTQVMNPVFINEHVQINGLEKLQKIVDQGRGGIIVSAHVGNWEMGGAVLPLLGYPMSVVALPHANKDVNSFFNQQREFFGCEVIQTNVAVRRVLEHLKANRLVAILAERDFGHHGLRMSFLNRSAFIPKGAALFSLKTGAPIIPIFFVRNENKTFTIFCEDPIYPDQTTQQIVSDDELKNYINRYLKIIEQYIYRYPTQWLMFKDFTQ